MNRTAATISIGDELLAGETLDSNARLLAGLLGEAGWRVKRHRVVGDDEPAIAAEIRDAAEHVGLVLVTGGLGPTADDLTRAALAAAMEEPLVKDRLAEETLEAFFAGRGYPMPEMNRSQAMRPESARCLPNAHGTAPGVAAMCAGTPVYLLPGPPHELKPMYEASVRPEIGDAVGTRTRELRSFGVGESLAAERIAELMNRDAEPVVGTTVSRSIVTARIRARNPKTTEAEIDAVANRVRAAWAPYIFGEGEDSLESVVGELLTERKSTLASAESCTGGLVAWMVTRIAGSSAWFRGGWVTYENRRKQEDLGVPAEILESTGAVSRETAIAMAHGARSRAGADYGVSTTGIAGPGGGTDDKPVGTVWIAVADARGESVRRFRFPGGRSGVRDRTAKAALQMIRFRLLEEETARLLWEEPLDG